jgi:hypothetical protein
VSRRRDFVPWLRTATDYVNTTVPFKARWVMFHLISEADYRTGRADSSYTRIAESLGVARNTVMAHVETLQTLGEVITCPSGSGVVLKIVNYDLMTGRVAQVAAQPAAQELSSLNGSPAQVGAQLLRSDSPSDLQERAQDLQDFKEEQEAPLVEQQGTQPELDPAERDRLATDFLVYATAWARCREVTRGVVARQDLVRVGVDAGRLVLAARSDDDDAIRTRILQMLDEMGATDAA